MAIRRAVILCCSFLFVAIGVGAQTVDVTGTWSGSATLNGTCHYSDLQGRDVSVPFSGTVIVKLTLLQSGGLVNGTLEVDNVPNQTQTCQVSGTLPPLAGPLTGSISGSNFSVTAILPGDKGPLPLTFAATVSGSSMSFNASGKRTTVNGTLNQTSSQAPASGLTGTYTGTFTATIVPCGNPPGVTYSGSVTLGLIQAGTALTGSISLSNTKRDICNSPSSRIVVDDGPGTLLLTAQISGSTITGLIVEPNGKSNPMTATISGNTISGSSPGSYPGEGASFTVTRSSTGTPQPAVSSFIANPSTISAGGSSTLSWSTVNASSVSIDNGIGTQGPSGSVSVSPTQTTTYALTVTGPGGSASSSATVTVTAGAARIVIGTLPSGMLQASGESGAKDSFTVANVGTASANVSLTSSGSFFIATPTSFTLQPGASQSVTITANTQPADTYDGTIAVTGDGMSSPVIVPVRLLVAAAPSGSVNPQPNVPRVDLSAPANQNPTGSVSFTNSGSAQMIGIAVGDVPWIVPQSGTITISPGETKSVSFSIDRTKRPDSAALIGGATGALSLRFLGSPVGSTGISDVTTPTSTITVTIVDIVKPGVTPGSPPPLQSGELALLIGGHGSTVGIAGDLLLSNRSSSPIPDLKLFLIAVSQGATLPQLASNLGVTLPSVSTSIFGWDSGSLVLRSSSLQNIAAAAMRMANPSGSAAYFSAIPVFRSDRGAGPGGRLVLAGVERTATTRTVLIVQELTGNSATADIQAYDISGALLGAKTSVSMTPFVSSTDTGSTVIAGARSVVITNTSSGSARINAYARVVDDSTNDAWIVVDPSSIAPSATTTFIMPTIASSSGSVRTDVYVTNGSSLSTSTTMDVIVPAGRRRSVRRVSNSLQPEPSATQQLTVRPLETQNMTVSTTNGYVRFSGGSISASGRLTVTAGGKTFGSALPVLPSSSAIGSGEMKRFAGVGDASQKTIAAATPATFRSSLIIIETSGQSASVRVSVWYSFPAGALVSAQTVSSKELVLGANQVMTIGDLARSIIGSQRDSFGDLRDMQVDIEVIGGDGKVLSFIESIDNGSGDVVVRSD